MGFKKSSNDPAKPKEAERFLGGEELNDFLAELAPFQATRSIGTVKDEELTEFGLKDTKEELQIVTKGGEANFKVGKKSYGSRNYFLQNTADGRVFLIDGKPIQTLTAAKSRPYER